MGTGKLDEAGRLLSDLLDHNPNDGETNLAEARLLVREGEWENAFAYYHRAIYGSWDSQARLEGVLTARCARVWSWQMFWLSAACRRICWLNSCRLQPNPRTILKCCGKSHNCT